jgi:dTDP-4-amino-4,6-dideoxygalactose transaminase
MLSAAVIAGKPRAQRFRDQWSGPADVHAISSVAGGAPFWLCGSGRRALYEALCREGDGEGRRIWIPALVCQSVVPVIRSSGYVPALYDVDYNLRPDLRRLDLCADDLFLLVHFFGLVQSTTAQTVRQEYGARVIEDCAHLLKPAYQGSSAGIMGEWSFFSFRKQLPVTCGAMLLGKRLAGDPEQPRINHRLTARDALLMAERFGPALTGPYYSRLVEWTRAALEPWRGRSRGLWRPAGDEAISASTLRAFRDMNLDRIAERRCENYRQLVHLLDEIPQVQVPLPALQAGSIPMVLPILVNDDNRRFRAALLSRGIGAFLWPGFEALTGVDWERFPGSRDWLRRLVCLPVHQDVNVCNLTRIRDACTQAVAAAA